MKKNRLLQTFWIFVCTILLGFPSLSAETTEQRLERMEKEIQELKAQKKEAPSLQKDGIPPWYQAIKLSGFMDVSYDFNFNRQANPAFGAPPTNPMRLYDPNATGFRFHVLELVFESQSQHWPDWLAFRTDIWIGQDAPLLSSAGFNIADDIELQQAYVDLIAPVGNSITFRTGKWVTLIDNEVDESRDNYNYSRSFNFAFGIPASHLGILAIYPLMKDQVIFSFGIVNGWNKVNKTNHAPVYIARVDLLASEKFSFEVSGITGPEDTFGTTNDSSYRGVVNTSATWKPISKLALVGSFTWGQESNVIFQLVGPPRHAAWMDVYAIVAYDFTDWFQLANRVEYFRDPDGFRTVGQLQPAFPFGVYFGNNYMWEDTITATFTLRKNVKTRLEFRHDHSSQPVFVKDTRAVDYQNTITAALTLGF